ncbi:MAG TPA: thiamine-phosphate kinase [Woeseiaceae bacterium]|nr:thiamine-phosphate kinase [Woeseiaceae bacterium]
MDEFELIRRYFARPPGEGSGVLVGIGDDGAVLSATPGCALVSVVDTLVEGVHWPAALSPADVGFRAVAVNVSDVAAMGGRPRWMTLALTLAEADESWLGAFTSGLFECAQRYGVALVGGDVTRGRDIVLSVQVTGEVDPARVLCRSGASEGDAIWVTGTPGDSAGGLALCRGDPVAAGEQDRGYLIARFARPDVRAAFAADLAGLATAAIDVSDGLFADAEKLLAASGAGGRIDVAALPCSAPLVRVFGKDEAERLALTGGEDYELCFTAKPAREADIRAAAARHGVEVTRIGEVTAGESLGLVREGHEVEFSDAGWRHFR